MMQDKMEKQYIAARLKKLPEAALASISACIQYEYNLNKNRKQKNFIKNLCSLVLEECGERGWSGGCISPQFDLIASAQRESKKICHELIPLYLGEKDWRGLRYLYLGN